jgi:hypothetical protein
MVKNSKNNNKSALIKHSSDFSDNHYGEKTQKACKIKMRFFKRVKNEKISNREHNLSITRMVKCF